jgi:hypothetical protein
MSVNKLILGDNLEIMRKMEPESQIEKSMVQLKEYKDANVQKYIYAKMQRCQCA